LNITLQGLKKPAPKRSGFHAKAKSEAGALRQRSMGNRMTKPSRSK